MNREKKLESIAYNAIGYMLETSMNNEDLTMTELIDEIAEYLGFSVEELDKLGVLDSEDLIRGWQ